MLTCLKSCSQCSSRTSIQRPRLQSMFGF